MKKGTWHIIGLMSGTSLDGVDLAYIEFRNLEKIHYKIIQATSIPYSTEWKSKLTNAFSAKKEEVAILDIAYSKFLGELINTFIKENNIKKVDFVASHGHTIFHKPNEGYTLQIGNKPIIVKICNQTVVCDFRVQDVALGGQGAPLVPIGDQLLFSEYDYCLNIGGFANVSYDENGLRQAYDICPANIILNHYTRKIGFEYDHQGKLARSGKLSQDLLNVLDTHPMYQSKNSLGNEIVVSEFIPIIDSYNLNTADILHTYIEHFAKKIAEVLKPKTTTLITGGGTFNSYLIERIKEYTTSHLVIPSNQLINYKEALIFALLGLLKFQNEVNCLPPVTGAKKNHTSGFIYNP